MAKELLGVIPLAILIIGALVTRRITEPAFFSSIAAVIILRPASILPAYLEKMYQVLGNPSFQVLVIVGLGFSGMSALFEQSGAMGGFKGTLKRFCKGRKTTLVATWILGGVIFIDDYLNALAVSASMKGISDEMRVPREHLAYTVNCMGACVCVMLPFSSWAAFAVGSAAEQGLGITDYLKAIPLMFYPICAIIICFLVAVEKFPRIGELKKAYERVENGGPLLTVSAGEKPEASTSEQKDTTPLNFLIPMAALIIGMLIFDKDIVAGMLICLLVMLIMFTAQKLMTFSGCFETFLKGAATLTPMLINIYITFIMEMCLDEMGFTAYLSQQLGRTVPGWILPAMAFLSVAAITFFAASFWTLIVISFPIFLPMAAVMGVSPSLVIAAVMSGVALGSQACLYSDAIFMVAAGTDVPNDTQFRTVLPYVLIGVVPATILFLAAGILM